MVVSYFPFIKQVSLKHFVHRFEKYKKNKKLFSFNNCRDICIGFVSGKELNWPCLTCFFKD